MAGFKGRQLSGRKRKPAGRFDTQKKKDEKPKSAPSAGPKPVARPRPAVEAGDGEVGTPAARPPVKRFAREAPSFATRRKEREAINAGKEPPSLARGKRKPVAAARPKVKAFRILIVAHRPKYRARCERACSDPIWEHRALLNREDPIGMIHQEVPAALVISVDIEEKTNTGYLRASQAYRAQGMKVLALFESEEDAEALKESFDVGLVAPWKTEQVEERLGLWYRDWARRNSG